jgi:hypothetical protein
MNIDDVLLTEKEIDSVQKYNKGALWDFVSEQICKAQCLKLLEWMKTNNVIGHKTFTVADISFQKNAPLRNVCYEDCKLCELESKLKEGR